MLEPSTALPGGPSSVTIPSCTVTVNRAGSVKNPSAITSTGELTAVFYGRAQIAGLEPGVQIRLHGMVGIGDHGRPAMINPAYELLS
jgi:hypothetical protein